MAAPKIIAIAIKFSPLARVRHIRNPRPLHCIEAHGKRILIGIHPIQFTVTEATRRKHLTLCDVRDHFALCIHGFVMPIQRGSSWGELKLPQSRFHANWIKVTKIQVVHRHTFVSVATHN